MVDGFVLVTEFGKTSTDVLRRALRSSTEIRKKLIGAVLNKVDLRQLARLENVGGTYYTSEYYMEDGAAPVASSNVPWASRSPLETRSPQKLFRWHTSEYAPELTYGTREVSCRRLWCSIKEAVEWKENVPPPWIALCRDQEATLRLTVTGRNRNAEEPSDA